MTKRLGWLCLAALVVLDACGGGGSGNQGTTIVPPSGLSYPGPQTYYVETPIQTLTPTISGSLASYSVSPPLPAGLELNPTTGAIAGGPHAAGPTTVYTITARNAAGQATYGLSITVILPTVAVLSGAISRTVVAGTPISVAVTIQPNFTLPGALYANAVDTTALFGPAVTVTPGTGGVYTLELTTRTAATAGIHADSVTIYLCEDAACQTEARVRWITVPFSVIVMTSGSAWPGNNLTTLSPWPGAPDWATFQGNAGHTGYVPVTVNPDRFATRWYRAASDAAGQGAYTYRYLNSVTTSGGQIFSGEGLEFLATNEQDGSVNWRYSVSALDYPATNPPAVSNNVVYANAGNASSTRLLALDATTGALRWASPMESQWSQYLAPTIGPSGAYANAGYTGGVYGFDTAGNRLFFSGVSEPTQMSTPAVDAAGVYAYGAGALRVLDPLSGAVLHSITDPTFTNYVNEIDGSPVLGAPGSVFVANYVNMQLNNGAFGNTLLDFDVPSGTVKWQVFGGYPTTPAYHAGVLYATNTNPIRLEARSETDGHLVWWWTPPLANDAGFASEVLLTDNLVFVCTKLSLYAIDLTTHKVVWSYPIVGRLALSAQGVLYVAGETRLTAFNVK